jgi:hypothetical protein
MVTEFIFWIRHLLQVRAIAYLSETSSSHVWCIGQTGKKMATKHFGFRAEIRQLLTWLSASLLFCMPQMRSHNMQTHSNPSRRSSWINLEWIWCPWSIRRTSCIDLKRRKSNDGQDSPHILTKLTWPRESKRWGGHITSFLPTVLQDCEVEETEADALKEAKDSSMYGPLIRTIYNQSVLIRSTSALWYIRIAHYHLHSNCIIVCRARLKLKPNAGKEITGTESIRITLRLLRIYLQSHMWHGMPLATFLCHWPSFSFGNLPGRDSIRTIIFSM